MGKIPWDQHIQKATLPRHPDLGETGHLIALAICSDMPQASFPFGDQKTPIRQEPHGPWRFEPIGHGRDLHRLTTCIQRL